MLLLQIDVSLCICAIVDDYAVFTAVMPLIWVVCIRTLDSPFLQLMII